MQTVPVESSNASAPDETARQFNLLSWWKTAASLLAGLSAALTIGVAGYIVVLSLTQNTISIEPLSTPKVMVDNGYTPEVAAAHFRAALRRALSAALSTGPQLTLHGEQPDIVVPSVGISAQTIASYVRKFLPISRAPIISGEFTMADDQLWLRLRSGEREIYSSTRGVSPERVRDLMDAAAPAVLREVWPIYIVLTSYRRDPNEALEVADLIIATASRSSPDVRDAYRLKGMIYADRKQYHRAVESFTSALQLENQREQRALDHIARGKVFQQQSKTKDADEEFSKAAELAKDFPLALVPLHLAQGGPFAAVAAAAEIRKFRKSALLAPGAHVTIGFLFSQLGMTDDAITEYRKAIRTDPYDIAAHINLGIAYFDKKQWEDAAASYRKAIAIDPHDERLVTAHMELGEIMREQGRLEEAEAEFRKVIEMPLPTSFLRFSPNILEWAPTEVDNSTRARNELGAVLREQGKLDEAKTALTENIKYEPRNAEGHRELALVLRDQKKPEDAITELRKAVKLDPTAPAARFYLASILRDQGKPDEAIAEFRETIRIAPKDAQAYRELGLVLFDQNKPDEAVSELRIAITLDPDEPITHLNLGVILRSQGKVEEAVAALGDAIRLGPHVSQAYLELAGILSERGKPDEAILELRKAIERAPQEIATRVELASILLRQGDLDDAIAEYREILKVDSASGAAHYKLAMALVTKAAPTKKVLALIEACQLLVEGKRLTSSDPDFGPAIKRVNRLMARPRHCPNRAPLRERRIARR